MKPTYFDFTTTLERNCGTFETEEHFRVTVMVESYAASVGFPGEGGSGLECTIVEVEHLDRDSLSLSSDEMEQLENEARGQLRYH